MRDFTELDLSELDNLKCFICEERLAVRKGSVTYDGVTLNLCLCDKCLQLTDKELVKRILN